MRATISPGIPYATAERFEPPRELEDRTAPFIAQHWSPMCPQPPDPVADRVFGPDPRALDTDEHCQRLSITMPAGASARTRPVMVWIHGGGYVTGAGDAAATDPAALVVEQDVIVVTVTYRLGLLGFVQTPNGPKANLGLLDQVEAFRWIRRNIAAFGGDPEQVTAFGQSAGAAALVDLMSIEGCSSLFRRVIIQSAPLGIMRGRARMNRTLATHADAARPTTPIAALAAVQATTILAGAAFGLRGGMPIAPQYGCAPLRAERAVPAALRRIAPEIDVLIGCTSEEARLFLPIIPGLVRWFAMPILGPVLERGVVAFCTWFVYARGVHALARRHRRARGRASSYVLSWSAGDNPLGAAHTIDLPLLFGDESTWADAALIAGAPWRSVDADGRLLRAVWGRFARAEDIESVPGVERFLEIQH